MIGFGLAALAVLKKLPWYVYVLIAYTVLVYAVGNHVGSTWVQNRWDDAIAQTEIKGHGARAKAEATVLANPSVVEPKPCRVRDDFDRDCQKPVRPSGKR